MSAQVDCYNCSGANRIMVCGLPLLGCPVCEKYGDGWGNLNSDYPREPVIIDGVTYSPPPFDCVWCKDTGKFQRIIWDERLRNEHSSDYGHHLMPKRDLPCFKCYPDDFTSAYEEAKREILAKDPERSS